jgi:hypothetical protein
MSNMKMVSLVTVILMVTVLLLHGMNYFTKLLLGGLLFAGWLLFAIVRTARERRRARQSGDNA